MPDLNGTIGLENLSIPKITRFGPFVPFDLRLWLFRAFLVYNDGARPFAFLPLTAGTDQFIEATALVGVQLGAHAFGQVADLIGRARLGQRIADDLELGRRAFGVGAEGVGDVPGGGARVGFGYRPADR
ncbi:MAG: hypothetical protein JKY68_00690 [Rhodospirillales bacterium]|nr:hypothetical protein [Rhodospirillales bacterium]